MLTSHSSWHDRIQFSALFGIATSVELFQARLLKSTARCLYGAQFDVVQAGSVLETVFKTAVAGNQSVMRIGPSLLRSLVDRQQDQVAGIQVFISSLKVSADSCIEGGWSVDSDSSMHTCATFTPTP